MKYQNPELERPTRPTGTKVVIRSRDDLDPSSDTVKVEHSGRSVTAVPENVGLCEVIAVGPDVTNVKPGDVCFIDFYDVAQGYLVSGEELYITEAMALRMTLDLVTEPYFCPFTKRERQRAVSCDITPLPGYVLTKHAPDRMTVAVTGCDRILLPRSHTTSGIVGGRNSDGDPCTFVCYEEVVKFTPGAIQQERFVEAWDGSQRDTYYEERRLKAKIQKLERALDSLLAQVDDVMRPAVMRIIEQVTRVQETDWGLATGDLVCFCSSFSIQFRAMGELFRCVPYKSLLATIDDRAILRAYNATHPPAPLVQIIGGGTERLYGT